MKLADIVIQEQGPEGDKPIELKELTEYFPNTHAKAVKTLGKSGRLLFGGQKVFTPDGDYGPALKQAIAEAEQLLKDKDTTVDVDMELDGSVAGIDEHAEFTDQHPIDDFQETYIGYSPRDNNLIIGFDAWLDEETFNQDFDDHFEETFGEEFDPDNPDHEKIFNKAWKNFKDQQGFMGLAVEVNDDFGAALESMPFPDGFHKGGRHYLTSKKVVDL